ncbi:MAG: 1,4-alpha-glucan branching protein GlgB [Acidimicrobiia bacterium]|nr:1,4-alpha-glucan branching protein GlgB [Acidimicrobiia bacterium]
MVPTAVEAHEIEAVIGGYHGDPFRILGPHAVKRDFQSDAWEIRAFLPQAESAEVILDNAQVPLTRIEDAGFFQARFDAQPGAYRFRIRRHGGHEETIADPYRFQPLLTDYQLHLHGEGSNFDAYLMLGAHPVVHQGVAGTRFAVWAPNALIISVVGDFNDWDSRRHPMRQRTGGVWEIFLPDVGEGAIYKYFIRSRHRSYQEMKSDPYAFACEAPPRSGSIVTRLDAYTWSDEAWMQTRAKTDWLQRPISIYEVHLGSWLRGEHHRVLGYRELADKLVPYVKEMGYTHIELLPILEHPFTGSWGYQVTGFFSPTARHGSPADFQYLVDRCHQEGIGVLLDWVPAHFPKDAHGLAFFDGTALYEHEDPRMGEHRDWGTLIFNFGRNEVRTFLISSALFWLKQYHIDGLRVDAVASMLYLDYSREPGDWIPNMYGGNENLEAINFLKRFNEEAHKVAGAITIAEESTAFPAVSRPVYTGGLGFTFKWNMGWMHDMLDYFSKDPVHRKYHHHNLTFSLLYAFTENFILPISHDEVVHGKRSLLSKMPGDEWRRFAGARAFLAYMYGHPGKKLLFMGSELGQYEEWSVDASLRWDLLQYGYHRKLQALNRELNRFYRAHPCLYEVDYHYSGFDWVDFHDVEASVISFLRWSADRKQCLLFVCNFTPVPRYRYRIGVPSAGMYREAFNTDAEMFGGSNVGNAGAVSADPVAHHNQPARIEITLPPLAVVVFEKMS